MSDSKITLPAREGYDRWAPLYDQKTNRIVGMKQRTIERLMGDVRGLEVVDLGCGTGRNAAQMAEAGANVTGVDFSEGMLAEARRRPGAGKIRWIVGSLEQPIQLPDAAFDKALCSLALEHVEDLPTAFFQMRRIVRPSGEIAVVEMHPAMMLKGLSARFHDPKTGQEIRPRSVGHQISDFVKAIVGAGLTIADMEEIFDDSAEPRWPALLTFILR